MFRLRINQYLFLFLALGADVAMSQEKQVVIYPGSADESYFGLLLQHALSYSKDKTYQTQASGAIIPKERDLELLDDNELQVVFSGAYLDNEQKYLAVRFPILKGLLGWRIPLVRETDFHMFKNVYNLAEFKKLVPGQFHTWGDNQILEANGITVVKGTHYEGLFGMLSKGRFDYFPRSILEIDREYLLHKNLNIAIEPNIIIHYPTAYYFFVNKTNQVLADDLLAGLEAAHLDGSLTKLFMQFYGVQVNKVINTKRRVIELDNPFLPKETPLQRSDLWIKLTNQSSG